MKWGFLDDDSGYFYCIIYNSDPSAGEPYLCGSRNHYLQGVRRVCAFGREKANKELNRQQETADGFLSDACIGEGCPRIIVVKTILKIYYSCKNNNTGL